ncbi:MAG: transporter substrate-binding domain-containing protein [Mesorhizobium sp.]
MKFASTLATVALGAVLSGFFSTAALAQDLIEKIKSSGTMRIGVAPGAPYQFPDPATGVYEGFNIDLANKVAGILGVKVEVVESSWATLSTGLQAGQFDVIFANVFATPERAVSVSFTQPYFNYGFHVMVLNESPITSLDQLNSPDVIFSGMSGTVEARYPAELYPSAQVKELVTDNSYGGPLEVVAGRATAAFVDPGIYRIMLAQNPDLAGKVRLLNDEDHLLKPVGLAWAVMPQETHMLNFLNVFIQDLINNGEHIKLRDTWFDKLASAK